MQRPRPDASTPADPRAPHEPGHPDAHAAREYYEHAMRELDQDAPPPAVGALLLQIARTHVASGHHSAAIDCTEAVFALPDFGDMDAVLAEAHELRGRLRCEVGDLAGAEQDFLAQQQRARAAGLQWLIALGFEHLASVSLVRGAWSEGAERLEEAASAFREQGDDEATIRVQLQLARLYVDLKRWNAAEQALGDALPRAQRANDLESLARLELVRAHMAIERANVERARISAERALELARRAEHPALAAECVAMAGITARELGELDRALRLFDDAERQAAAHGDTMLLGELACERVEVLARQGDHRRTLRALNQAYRTLARLLGETGSVERGRRLRRLETAFLGVACRWADRFESADQDTTGHVERVADLTCEVARRMGVDPTSLFGYRVGAYLHDLGKLAIPATILNKRGRLTPDEWAAVKRHPVVGAEMLTEADFPWEVRPIVESHHECWDGSGYPHGRAGEEIPLAARIFTAADVYDALITRRPFKEALSRDEAVEVMRRDVGRQFDPAVFRVFEDVIREGIPIPGVTSAAAIPVPPPPTLPLVDDPLTSVAEFASWTRRASASLAELRRGDGVASLLLIDIDDFRRVNNTYGRLQGDDVLWAVAKVLQRGIRTGDVIGRRGSDEFVVLLPGADAALAAEIAGRLREGVAGLRCAVRNAPEETLVVTTSIAVASAPPDGEVVEALLASADRALFRAKREGRDRVVAADRQEPARVQQGLELSAFVGREEELRTVVAQLDLAARSEPRFVCVSGEAGIGKSALVTQLGPEVRLRAGFKAQGRVLGDGSGGPLAPWGEVIADLVRQGAGGDRVWRALPQLVPDLLPGLDPAEADASPAVLEQEVVAFVRRAARDRVLVVVLEDMHLAPPASWATLDALLSAVDDERLLLVYTLRPEVPAAASEWRRRIQQHARSTHIQLRRFGLDDVRRWLRAVFHDAEPGEEVARWVHEFAEGIPLLVLHLLRAGCEDGTIWYGGTRWEWRTPDTHGVSSGIGWVLERRLDRLSPGARQVLAAAAVLEDALTVELLVSVTGATESRARAALDEGVSASILTATEDASGLRFSFRHPLLGEACARGMPERQRQQVHELAARVLELRAPSATAAIAAHYHSAGNDAAAFAYAVSAAERHLAACTHDAALAALQVAQRYAPSSAELAALRVRHAEVAVQAGRYAQASGQCDLALEWLDRQPVDAVTVRARRLREWVQFRRGKPAGRTAEAMRSHVNEAATTVPAELASTALVASECALERADWPEAAALSRRALEGAVGDGAEPVVAEALLSLGIAEHAETPELGVPRLRQAVDRCTALGDPWREARALHALGDALARQEGPTGGEHLLVGALERARASHHARLAALASRSLGVLRARQGSFDEARQWLGDAERLYATIEDEPDRVFTQLAGAIALHDAGERKAAHGGFEHVARRARELDLAWIELAATSGAALCNGGPDSAETRGHWQRTSELAAIARPDWWFVGRELVDAFAVRMALASGHPSVAHDLFVRATRRLDAIDSYGSAWLVASCARDLERAGLRSIERTRVEASERARRLGFTAIAGALSG